eukprot:scaffold309_cov39-Phaeocystis_antarctica.AAC.3
MVAVASLLRGGIQPPRCWSSAATRGRRSRCATRGSGRRACLGLGAGLGSGSGSGLGSGSGSGIGSGVGSGLGLRVAVGPRVLERVYLHALLSPLVVRGGQPARGLGRGDNQVTYAPPVAPPYEGEEHRALLHREAREHLPQDGDVRVVGVDRDAVARVLAEDRDVDLGGAAPERHRGDSLRHELELHTTTYY